jgi:hypothetical protein
MVLGKAAAYPSEVPFRFSTIGLAPVLTQNIRLV